MSVTHYDLFVYIRTRQLSGATTLDQRTFMYINYAASVCVLKKWILCDTDRSSIWLEKCKSLVCDSPIPSTLHPFAHYFCCLGAFHTFFKCLCCFGYFPVSKAGLHLVDDGFNSIPGLINFLYLDKIPKTNTTNIPIS